MTTYIMSTTVIPGTAAGLWEMLPLSTEEARQTLMASADIRSAVGHSSTAEAMTELIGIEIRFNRITVEPEEGDKFVCFRLKSRPPEGAILDRETLESIGYELSLMIYHQAY